MGKFYKVDLSSMKEVERFTDEVVKDIEKKGGIDYLVLSAGGPPLGRWRRSSEVPPLAPSPVIVTLTSRASKGRSRCSVYHGKWCEVQEGTNRWGRFYTTYRLLPWIKQSVVVIGSPGAGAFFDESDPGFEKPDNRKQMTLLRQGRRDCLYLDAIFKVPPPPLSTNHVVDKGRNSQYGIPRSRSIIFSLDSSTQTVSTTRDFTLRW